MLSRQWTNWRRQVSSIAFPMILCGILGSAPAVSGPDSSVPPPPAISGGPSVIYSSYPTVLIGNRPEAASSPTKTVGEIHYRYSPESPGVLAFINQTANCDSTDAAVRIIVAPKKGRLQVERGLPPSDVNGDFWGKNDPRYHCDASKAQALWVRYIPTPGSNGPDSAVVEVSDSTETAQETLWIEIPA